MGCSFPYGGTLLTASPFPRHPGFAGPPGINQAMYTSFPDAQAAGLQEDGTLTVKSPNRRVATDGRDIGVDFDELKRAGAGPFLKK